LTGVLAPLAEDPQHSGLFSDFDGTLSPIVDDPEQAGPVDGVPEVLAALAGKLAKVGIISGRPAAFLLRHLGDSGVDMWGLHGLERVEDGEVAPAPEAEEWCDAIEEAAAGAERDLDDAVHVERKNVAVTLHYRHAPTEAKRVEKWVKEIAASTGLAKFPGRMSFELRPPVPHGKGHALEQAASGLKAVCFIGDDWGDMAGFDALDRLEAEGARVVRVAVESAEAPQALLERSDHVADGPREVLALLKELAAALD
jgi:trehalose 6-phosphate phosphatase